jgi:nicotinamide-nucleotide amidase
MKAEIITIGDEILIGQVVNSNAAWIGEMLTGIGIEVNRNMAIPDLGEEIKSALEESASRSELVIITGGLGPTRDDITKKALAEYFGSTLVKNEVALLAIKDLLGSRGVNMNPLNEEQAVLPDNCIILPNRFGTASGMWFSKNGTEFISLPGVPYEMKAIITGSVLPLLRDKYSLPSIIYKTLLIQGIPESHLAESLSEFEDQLPVNVKLAYLPSPGRVRLRLTGIGEDEQVLYTIIDKQTEKLRNIIPKEKFYGFNDEQLEQVIGTLLKEKGNKLALAESCTGGTIAQMITSVPGSSEYFLGAVVAYSNDIKERILGVKAETLNQFGAVSDDVIRQMAEGVLKVYGADYAIATSGIAGPDGGSSSKPVGTTWIAVASKEKTISKVFHFGEHRGRNIQKASLTGLNMLRLLISA